MIQWHRRAGLLVVPIILMLTITGILINHSQQLGFARQPVFSALIGWLYGVEPQTAKRGFSSADSWISQLGQTIYLNEQPLAECHSQLLGALFWQQTHAVLCDNRITLFLPDGQAVEELAGLPVAATALGLIDNNGETTLALAAPVWYLDQNAWQWQTAENGAFQQVQWASSEALPAALAEHLNQQQPLPGINVERVLLDLHSGRLFGQTGVIIIDLASLLFAFLALSGLYTWLKRTLRSSKNKPFKRRHRY
nr:PepSY-associated TM helix domain-containing protein [Oceanobacter mangrovi]